MESGWLREARWPLIKWGPHMWAVSSPRRMLDITTVKPYFRNHPLLWAYIDLALAKATNQKLNSVQTSLSAPITKCSKQFM